MSLHASKLGVEEVVSEVDRVDYASDFRHYSRRNDHQPQTALVQRHFALCSCHEQRA